MAGLLRLTDIDQFRIAGRIPEAAVSPEIQSNVQKLDEDGEIEAWLRQLLGAPDRTPHGPTEIADILTTKVTVNGVSRSAAFVNKGKATAKVNSRAVAHQFLKLRQIPGVQVIVLLAVGDIQDDAQRDFIQTAFDLEADYLIANRLDVARLFLAARKICPKDGLPYQDGFCAKGHEQEKLLELHYRVSENVEFEIVSLEDVSHGMAKRLSAVVLADRHYPQETFREVVVSAIRKARADSFVRSELVKARFGDAPADVVWVYVGADMLDVNNANWICRACWIVPTLDPRFRPLWDETDDVVDGARIVWNAMYHAMKELLTTASGDKGAITAHVEKYLKQAFDLLSVVRKEFGRYTAGTIDEAQFLSFMTTHLETADRIYDEGANAPIPPADCQDYEQRCQNILAQFHNLWLAFGYPNDRTPENRRWLFEFSSEQIDKELPKLEFEREKIGLR